MQLFNLEEDYPNHFSSSFSCNMLVCEKVAFRFAVVRMFGVVLSGVISTASIFLDIIPGGWDGFWNFWENQTMFEITVASSKATISHVIRKIIQMAVQNQSYSHYPGLLLPFWIWLILTHCTSFHWHSLACPLSPQLDFLSAASQQQHIPSATQRIKESCQHNSWPRKRVIHQCVYSLNKLDQFYHWWQRGDIHTIILL